MRKRNKDKRKLTVLRLNESNSKGLRLRNKLHQRLKLTD